MSNVIPQYVVNHMNMSHVKEYRKDVIKNHPLPEGYSELEYGDEGIVYDRLSLKEKEIKYWDDFNFEVFLKADIGEDGCNPIWYVKKI